MVLTRTVGIVGTLVWDRLIGPTSHETTSDVVAEGGAASVTAVEHWGGIAYGLAAAAAALPDEWRIRPIVKVGRDMSERAQALWAEIPRLDETGLTVVDAPNNRVELRYHSAADRVERLTGGVPGWEWPELFPLVADLDALLINFISGYEMTLDTALQLRSGFAGPIHADLHSLFLGRDDDGTRRPRVLDDYGEWSSCFDIVQMNEDEAGLTRPTEERGAVGSPGGAEDGSTGRIDRAIDTALDSGPRLAVVTRGASGVVWRAVDGVPHDPTMWSDFDPPKGRARAASRTVTIRAQRSGDPTGCGDVWGATMFSRLLAGDGPENSIDMANRLAARNIEHRGAEGLYDILRSEVRP